jgi:hypothetical protein
VRLPWALDDSRGTAYVGAPFVVWLEEQGEYVMVFQSMSNGHRMLELAYSADLEHWERTGRPILDYLPEGSRDPCVIRNDDGSFLLYLATPTPTGSSITVTRTRDFKQFDTTHTCLTIKDAIWYSGAESPFVLQRNGLYYLFVTYAHRHYFETLVYLSHRPDRFSTIITTLYAHAPEILQWHGKEYITSCGPEGRGPLDKHGLYMAELRWTE